MAKGFVLVLLGVAIAGFPMAAQWAMGITQFPGGHLTMVYKVTTDEGVYRYTLELIPKEEGIYTVRTEVMGEASLEELEEAGLFFAWQPNLWLANAWWLSFYFMLFGTGQPAEPGRTYVLFGGITFETEPDYVEIAGVRAVQGVLKAPDSPDQRVIIAISPDPKVPYPVLIRQEEDVGGGRWEVVSEIVLVEYHYSPS